MRHHGLAKRSREDSIITCGLSDSYQANVPVRDSTYDQDQNTDRLDLEPKRAACRC